MGKTCRKFKELFVEIRERASKALFFAKMLSKVRKMFRINDIACSIFIHSLYLPRTWRLLPISRYK